MTERRRRGMTVIEVVISILVAITVMGAAYTIYDSSTKLSRKATGISAAASAAARFFYALENDVANLRAQQDAAATFNTEDSDVTGTGGGTRQLYFTRRRPEKQFNIEFESWDYTDKDDNGTEVTYEAVKNPVNGMFDLRRYLGDRTAPIQETDFYGIWAKEVRFGRVKLNPPRPSSGGKEWGPAFLRVSLLLVSEVDPKDVRAVNASKPVLLSTLYFIPNLGSQVDKDRLEKDEVN